VPAQISGDAKAGDAADPRADLLDRRNQRIAEHQRPGQAVAELCTDLGIGGDAAGIVVRRAGDEARPQHLEQLSLGRCLGGVERYVAHGDRQARQSLHSATEPAGPVPVPPGRLPAIGSPITAVPERLWLAIDRRCALFLDRRTAIGN
jgi:hypothetical protein